MASEFDSAIIRDAGQGATACVSGFTLFSDSGYRNDVAIGPEPHNSSTASESCGSETNGNDCVDRSSTKDTCVQPPIHFVVLDRSKASRCSKPQVSGLCSSREPFPASSSAFMLGDPFTSTADASAFGNIFRLKPRHANKSTPAAALGNRGRKRGAQSMSAASTSSLHESSRRPHDSYSLYRSFSGSSDSTHDCGGGDDATASDTPIASFQLKHERTCGHSPGRGTMAALTFKGLSLHSPGTATATATAHVQSGFSGIREQSAGSQMDAGTSPLSLTGHQFSSFSKYNGSPAGSMICRTLPPSPESSITNSMRPPPPPRMSPSGGSTALSVSSRKAPLKLLPSTWAGSVPDSKCCDSSRPPLHGLNTYMQSLDTTATTKGDSEEDTNGGSVKSPKILPLTVLCHTSAASDGSVSTIHDCLDAHMNSAYVNPALSGRQARSDCMDTASRRSIASLSERTPLPRVSLTPRSTGGGSTEGLPRFPSPSDIDAEEDLQTPRSLLILSASSPRKHFYSGFASIATSLESRPTSCSHLVYFPDRVHHDVRDDAVESNNTLQNTVAVSNQENGEDMKPSLLEVAFRRGSSNSLDFSVDSNAKPFADDVGRKNKQSRSFIPLPDWGDCTMLHENRLEGTSTAIQAKSLLHPSNSHTSLYRMMAYETGCDDQAALSDIDDDDDEEFLLVSPHAIEVEKQQRTLNKFTKQRRIQVSSTPATEYPNRAQSWASFNSSVKTSSGSLFGMDFVTNTKSRGYVERELGTRQSSPSNMGVCSYNPPASTFNAFGRSESALSIGLTLEHFALSTADDSMHNGRDLVTPPALAQANSPPPLTPRLHFQERIITNDVDEECPPLSQNHIHQMLTTNHCLVTSSSKILTVHHTDRQTVAHAIAYTGCQSHEVKSPRQA